MLVQDGVTVGYTYDALFVTDGRSKRCKQQNIVVQDISSPGKTFSRLYSGIGIHYIYIYVIWTVIIQVFTHSTSLFQRSWRTHPLARLGSRASSVARAMPPAATCHGTNRHTDRWTVVMQRRVRSAERCTCPCQHSGMVYMDISL